MSRIIIYGIDEYYEFVVTSIKEGNEIIGVTDSFSTITQIGNFKYIPVDEICNLEYDYIVITSRTRRVRDEILYGLTDRGINRNKIISFFEIFHEDKVDKVMKRYPDTEYDGMIIGLSHAAKGINPKYLQGNWVNLAASSEDIFYHYEVIKKCFTKYEYRFSKLKYMIIDMYDYINFSYDLSLSSQAVCYWMLGGNANRHNFNDNTLFSNDIEREMSEKSGEYPAYYPCRSSEELQIRNMLFNEEYVYNNIGRYFWDLDPSHLGYEDFPCEMQNKGHIRKNEMLPGNLLLRKDGNCEKYKATEEENVNIFYEMIEYIRNKFPEIKIILTLLPRYAQLENIHDVIPYVREEKDKFEKYIKKVTDNRNVFFLNLKNELSISENYFYWRDISHLNYQGSIALTTLYNNFIQQMDKSQ